MSHRYGKWLIVVAILLSGCAPTKIFVVQSPDTLAKAGSTYKDNATLYVFRENTFTSGGWSLEVSVDGVKRTTLRTKNYAVFPVEPGKHDIKFHWLSMGLAGNKDIAISVEFSVGQDLLFHLQYRLSYCCEYCSGLDRTVTISNHSAANNG